MAYIIGDATAAEVLRICRERLIKIDEEEADPSTEDKTFWDNSDEEAIELLHAIARTITAQHANP